MSTNPNLHFIVPDPNNHRPMTRSLTSKLRQICQFDSNNNSACFIDSNEVFIDSNNNYNHVNMQNDSLIQSQDLQVNSQSHLTPISISSSSSENSNTQNSRSVSQLNTPPNIESIQLHYSDHDTIYESIDPRTWPECVKNVMDRENKDVSSLQQNADLEINDTMPCELCQLLNYNLHLELGYAKTNIYTQRIEVPRCSHIDCITSHNPENEDYINNNVDKPNISIKQDSIAGFEDFFEALQNFQLY